MSPVRLRLPATSANLGPGFDAIALALGLHLEIEATRAGEYSIAATGRNADLCSRLRKNLLIESYEAVLAASGHAAVPLAIAMHNEIPLGKGCGSSAAARLAGVALAARVGELGWSGDRVLEEAARLEGHPDNVAACWHGGLTVAAAEGRELATISIPPPAGWHALLVLPEQPLATAKARAVLPERYSRQEAVANIQSAALLTAAFARGEAGALRLATRDLLHQPYRMALCPLLGALLPLAGQGGILSATLSGAGPAVLLLLSAEADLAEVQGRISAATRHLEPAQSVLVALSQDGAKHSWGN